MDGRRRWGTDAGRLMRAAAQLPLMSLLPARELVTALFVFAGILCLSAVGAPSARAESGDSTVCPAGHFWGMSGTILNDAGDAPAVQSLIEALGVTHFRPTIRWSDIQHAGPDDWDWSGTDRVFDGYRQTRARALVLLNSGSAQWATDVDSGPSDAEPTADCPPRVLPGLDEPITGEEPYYIFVREAVSRYHDVAAAWLIDNEPSELWSWAGDAYSYACMARLAADAIHDADPEATAVLAAIPAGTISAMVIADRLDDPAQEDFVVAFASRMWGYPVTIDEVRAAFGASQFRIWERVEFFRQALALLPEMDALAANVLGIHARSHLAEDTAWAYADQMRSHGGCERPLIYTEVNPYLSDDLTLAQETIRLMVASLATGKVLGQAYHQFIDGTVDRVPEPNCGLVTDSLQPKTVYHAYQNLISLLGSVARARRLDVPQPLTGYEFELGEAARISALWSTEEAEVDLSEILGSRSPTFLDMVGEPVQATPDRVPVGPSPIYAVTGPLGMADVPQEHWAYDSILACLDAGVVAGYPDGTYRPDDAVTRDQMAVFIARAAAGGDDQVPTGPADASFPDVPVVHWAHRYVEFVRQVGIVSGYPDGLYRPDDVVDRAQMAAFIARSLLRADSAALDVPVEPTFPDVTPEGEWSWCYPHVEYLAREGIVRGYRDGCYHPDRVCSRDQMAVYIARAFGLLN